MYEKHIEELKALRALVSSEMELSAFDAAIELMRAAEPRDPAAEREHCENVLNDIVDALSPPLDSNTVTPVQDAAIVVLLLRERAAARAEGHALGREESQNEREMAQANSVAEMRRANELETKLQAAQAEIERLEACAAQVGEVCDQIETKLTDLRTAAERCIAKIGECEATWALRAATEASK